MSSGEWKKTPKGKCSKVYYKWRERWQKKGYEVKVSVKSFYPIYLKSVRCAECKQPFGRSDNKKEVKSVRVDTSRGDKIILVKDISIVHYSCNLAGNTNAARKTRKEPDPY